MLILISELCMEPGCTQSSVLREYGAMREERVACFTSPSVLIAPLLVAGVALSAGTQPPVWVPTAAHTEALCWHDFL